MNTNLFDLIVLSRKGDDESILQLIDKFKPLINKYVRSLDYDEDSRQDLIIGMIECIHKIPLQKIEFESDKYIISYINTSLKNKYIHLSKNRRKILSRETYEPTFNIIKDDNFSIDSNLILDNMIKSLSETEKKIISSKYINGLKDSEIATLYNISRQAVNQTKNRALKKLKKTYLN